MQDLELEAHRLKWKLAGHVGRIEDKRWAKRSSEWTPRNQKRRRGHQVVRWRDEMADRVGCRWWTTARDRNVQAKVMKNYFVL